MKKLVKTILFTLMLTLLSGCSGDSNFEVNMEQLKNTSGEYQFHDLDWDISPSQVEKLLGSSLQSLGTNDTLENFLAADTFEWANVKGSLTCEFVQGKLNNVSIQFKPELSEKKQFWNDIKTELCNIYGTVDADVRTSTSEELQISTESETYFWEETVNKRTALTLTHLSINGEFKHITLSVYVIPESKTP